MLLQYQVNMIRLLLNLLLLISIYTTNLVEIHTKLRSDRRFFKRPGRARHIEQYPLISAPLAAPHVLPVCIINVTCQNSLRGVQKVRTPSYLGRLITAVSARQQPLPPKIS